MHCTCDVTLNAAMLRMTSSNNAAAPANEVDEGKEDAHAANDAVEPSQSRHILARHRDVHSPETGDLEHVSRRVI